MMKKTKIKSLFSKNHIVISRVENVNAGSINFENSCSVRIVSSYYYNGYNDHNGFFGKKKKKGESVNIVKCESPLGFYYYKKVYNTSYDTKRIYISTVEVSISVSGKYQYKLIYPTSFGDNKVSVDTRPWEIYVNEKSMDSRFINILFSEVNKLFDLLYDNKIKEINYYNSDLVTKSETMSITEFKKKIYKDLFGDEKGIRFQTNDEKILSHGFDLKESFRKSKN